VIVNNPLTDLSIGGSSASGEPRLFAGRSRESSKEDHPRSSVGGVRAEKAPTTYQLENEIAGDYEIELGEHHISNKQGSKF